MGLEVYRLGLGGFDSHSHAAGMVWFRVKGSGFSNKGDHFLSYRGPGTQGLAREAYF